MAHAAYVIERELAQTRALAAAQASEERFRRTFDDAPIGMAIVRPDFTISGVNKAFCEMLGYRQDDLIGKSFLDVTHPDDVSKDAPLAASLFRGEITRYRIEKRYVARSGETLLGRLTATVVRDENGKPMYGLGMVENLQQLREAEQKLKAVLDATPAVIYLLDPQNRYLAINRALERLLNVSSDSVIGRSIYDHFPKQVADQFARNNRLAFESGATIESEEVVLTPRGELTFLSLKHPLYDAGGRPYAVCGVSTDITERKREAGAHQFLSEAAKIFDSSLDFETTLAAVAQRILPRLADICVVDVLDEKGSPKRVAVACSDPTRVESAEALRSILPQPNTRVGIGRVLRTRKSELRAQVDDEFLRDFAFCEEHLDILHRIDPQSSLVVPMVARGAILGSIALWSTNPARRFTQKDVPLAEEVAHRAALAIDNARLYREAQEMIRQRDEFLSVASHELRTPLTALGLQIDLLKRRGVQVDACRRIADRLGSLIDELLDVTRIRAGRLTLDRSEVDLQDLLRQVIDLSAAPERVSLESSAPCTGRWDKFRLEQVFTNLVSNAIKYGGGERVQVRLDSDSDSARVHVIDRGAGISPSDLDRIFRPYQRGQTVGTVKGLGLGLYISQEIVRAHGGTIKVFSERGKGSTFVVELPRS